MEDFNRFLDAFINGDTFIIFIVIMLMILLVLIIALFKTKNEYNKLPVKEEKYEPEVVKEEITKVEEKPVVEVKKEETHVVEPTTAELNLEDLKATSEEDKFDENKPLVKQVDIPTIQTYNDIIEIYENSEEENAVISAEELERKKQERLDELGTTDNQSIIQKYEEEQEKKAIISYEQLLKNASNITLSYKEEETSKSGAPKVNKIEVEKKEVTPANDYVSEEEFLKLLKEFRLTLE